MNYKNKITKYKCKYESKINLHGGRKDCDIEYARQINETSFIRNLMNLTPFQKSVFAPLREYPVCSYSIWNERKTQLYIPTLPTFRDRLFKYSNYHARAYPKLYKGDDGAIISEWDIVLWSQKHKKWYLINLFPNDDNKILLDLAKDLNLVEDSTFSGVVDMLSIRDHIKRIIGSIFIARQTIAINEDEERFHNPLKEIQNLLGDASRENTTASEEYIQELKELEKVNLESEVVSDDENTK